MRQEEQTERKHEERILKPKAPGRQRNAMPEPIDATRRDHPEGAIGQGVRESGKD